MGAAGPRSKEAPVSDKVDDFFLKAGAALDGLRRQLRGKVHMTLVVRIDDKPDRDIVVSDDDYEEVIRVMRRSQERERGERPQVVVQSKSKEEA